MIKRTFNSADASILEDLIAPEEPSLVSSLAKAILSLDFQAGQTKELARLLERNNAGTITEKQQARLAAYVRVGNFLSLLKAKARTSLSANAGRR